jgi:ERCC4-type nuclease
VRHFRRHPSTESRRFGCKAEDGEVFVDVHELASGVPAMLDELGVKATVAALPVGDYLVARGVIVERKSVLDLHESVVSGRFWRQIGGVRRAAASGYLLVEGADLDRGPLAPNAVRGVLLAVMEQNVQVLRSSAGRDSALWLARLEARSQLVRPKAKRPIYDQKPNVAGSMVSEAMLAAVPGISTVVARRLLARFGTIEAVVQAGPDEWRHVPGVGPRRASALAHALAHP